MQLNCEGWVNPYGDPLSTSTEICDDFYFFIDSVENNWSLRIPTSFPEPLFTETFVTGSEGTHIYELKYDMKTIGNGTAYIGKLVNGELETTKSFTDFSADWQTYSIIDTITTELNDTLVIGMAGDACDFCASTAFFDNITFSTDITSSINDVENLKPISVYPNPANEHLTFKLDPSLNINNNLYIYNVLGSVVAVATINQSVYKLNIGFFNSGPYYYVIKDKQNQHILSQGKFIVN